MVSERDDDILAVKGLEDESRFEASLSRIKLSEPDVERVEVDETVFEAEPVADQADAGQPKWMGKRLGKYRLLRQLGEGAMGMVVQARDVNLGRIVALKVLRKKIEGMSEQQRVKQFLREARAAAQIEHPNVARIYEIDQYDGWWYIAAEFIEGGTLRDVVKAAGPLGASRACPIIADAAVALSVAHQMGMIHQDIKPSNLMLSRTGRCKLVDFGLVHLDDPDDPFDLGEMAAGTPHYMAPEAIRRESIGPKIDIYSLGVTLYWTLTGEAPFTGKTIREVLRQHIDAPRPNPCDKQPECSETLARLVQRAMARDPDERPTAAEFASALRAEVVGSASGEEGSSLVMAAGMLPGSTLGGPAEPGSQSGTAVLSGAARTIIKPRRRVWPYVLAAALLVIAGIVGAWIWTEYRAERVAAVPPTPPADPVEFSHRFPNAPESYGLRSPGSLPSATSPAANPPAYGWRGRDSVQVPEDARYVSHEFGRYIYRLDDPAAALIDAQDAVFFSSLAEAQAAGKTFPASAAE